MSQGGATPGKFQAKPKGKPALGMAVAQTTPAESPPVPITSVPPLYSTYGQPKPAGAYFDQDAAQRAIDFIEDLTQYQGSFAGQKLLLLPWEHDIVWELFGWMNADGSRLYRKAYIEVPRKAGKSTLASAIGLYLAYGDSEAGPEVYFAAADKDQARRCYNPARIMAEHHSVLGPISVFYNSTKEIVLAENPGGIIKALSSDTKKLYGLNPHGLIFDELMTQPNRVMWDALTTGQGARRQSLIFAISTAGWDKNSVCFELHEYTRKLDEAEENDPTFLGVVYGAPEGADWTSPEVWRAAQPSLGWTVQESYYETEVKQALSMPTYQNTVRTLLLSQWVGQEVRFIPMEQWDSNTTSVDYDSLKGKPCFAGLDLASTTDLAAFILVFPTEPSIAVRCYFFIPEDGLLERGRRDHAPYATWVREGLIIATPGNVIDYSYIKRTILEAADLYDLKDISYDRWNATQLAQELTDLERLSMVQMGQGMASMSAPTKELLRLVMEQKVNHNNNPVLRWMAENTAAKLDEAGNIKPDKAKSTGRIDGIVGLVMALDGYTRRGPSFMRRSAYEDRTPKET